MNINELIQKEINDIDVDIIFKDELEKTIRETVRRTLKDQLGSYSNLSKQLENYLKENVKIDFEKISVPQYTNFVVDRCFDVVKELMTDEKSEKIKKHFRDKLAPHLSDVIKFGDLIDAISESLTKTLEESIKDDACCNVEDTYHIICEHEDNKYSDNYFSLKILDGKEIRNSQEIAALFMSNGKCYHSRGDKKNEFTKRFASYVYNNTIIEEIEEFEQIINKDNLY